MTALEIRQDEIGAFDIEAYKARRARMIGEAHFRKGAKDQGVAQLALTRTTMTYCGCAPPTNPKYVPLNLS